MAEQRAAAAARRKKEAEELLKSGVFSEVSPVKAVPGITKVLRETMIVPCGEPLEYHELIDAIGEARAITFQGRLAELATENSYIARADGNSINGRCPDSIVHGDQLLMTPLDEYGQNVKNGDIVFVKLVYKNRIEKFTLKAFEQRGTRKKLTAKNPRFKAPEFGEELEHAEVVAVCRGVVEKIFG